MATPFAADGKLGVSSTERISEGQQFHLGTPMTDNLGRRWLWVKANAETVATGTCTVDPATFYVTDAAGTYTADTAFTVGQCGWVRLVTSAASATP
jgi:hypothetical protein